MSHKFRQLVVWQRAMTLVTDIYKQTHDFPSEERFGLTSRLRRAATSIPLNIAEGSGSDSPAEFARFLQIALGSTYETMTALEISQRLNYRNHEDFAPLLAELDRIAAMLTGLLGCATTGFAGALGIASGLLAGSVTGWVMLYPRRA